MSTYQTTLKDNSGNELLPKTVLKAIADDNGYYLDSSLSAADINVLKNGMLNNTVRHNNETPGTPPSVNAGQLNGHYDSYFATESEIDIVRGQSQAYDPSETYDIGDYAIHTDILYRCLNNGVTGVFDATKWEVVDLTTLKDAVETNASAISSLSTWTPLTLSFPHGSYVAYKNSALKLVLISWNSTNNSTQEFTVDISSAPSIGQIYGAFRGDGYFTANGNTLKIVNNFGNYAVGQVVYITT